jgi:hypothetical protein
MAKKPDVQYICYQTEGSAARKLEFLRPRPKTRLPGLKKKKVTVIRLNPLAAIGTLMSAVLLILMIVSCFQISGLQEDTAAMHRYVNDLRAENNRLKDVYESNIDLDEIERQAIALGMIPAEEAQHITVSLPEKDNAGHSGAQVALVSGVD